MSDLRAVDVVFVCVDPKESEALLAALRAIAGSGGLFIENLSVDATLGAVRSEKIITFVLAFSGSIATGVIGNAVYDVLKSSVTSQCVIAGEPIGKSLAADKEKLEAQVRTRAQPYGERVDGP